MPMEASRLNNSGGLLLPVVLELFELREAGQISHSVKKYSAEQVIDLMLDADRVEAVCLDIHGDALSVKSLNPNH